MLTMKQTGMETRRFFINDLSHQSPTARVRDPEYHVVTREIDDRHFSKHEQRVSKNCYVFPGAWPDHPGVQGGSYGGGRLGERRGHAGHPDEARPGED